MIEERIDSGMEMAMMRVLRQLPRNSSTIRAVRAAAIKASVTTPRMAARTNTDWSPVAAMDAPSGTSSRTLGRRSLMELTMVSVEAEPVFWMDISTARRPSTRTTLVCGGCPSCTKATSRR